MILGQENDLALFGGLFEDQEAFSGQLSQVEMWNSVLPGNEIKEMATCKVETTLNSNKIISWSQNSWTQHNVEFSEVVFENMCEIDETSKNLYWLELIDQITFKEMCDNVGGQLPIINQIKSNDTSEVYNAQLGLFKAINQDAPYCFPMDDVIAFWLGLEKNGKTWTNQYDFSEKVKLNIAKKSNENCAKIFNRQLQTSVCEAEASCGICHVPKDKILYLKGLCSDHGNNDLKKIDVQFYLHGLRNGRPYFR